MHTTHQRILARLSIAVAALVCTVDAAAQAGPLSAGEAVFVKVFRHPELTTTTAIDAGGNVQLPFIGNVTIAGLTEAEATARVTDAFTTILKSPRVRVTRSGQGGFIPDSGERTAPMQTKLIALQNSNANVLVEALSTMVSPGGSVSMDPDTNTLLLTDTPTALENLTSVIQQLDAMETQITQVHIETQIAEVESTALRELGVRWFAQGDRVGGGYYANPRQNALLNSARVLNNPLANEQVESGGQAGTNTGFDRRFVDEPDFGQRLNIPVQVPTPGQLFLGYINTGIDVGVLLDALASDDKAETLAAPYIRTVNHKTAEIRMVEEFPFTEVASVGLNAITSVDFLDIGITLEVTPHVKHSEATGTYVQLELEPEVSMATGLANGVPVRAVRSSRSVANVGDGQTLVIGGIVSSDTRDIVTKVPGFGEIPILGNLFKRTEKSSVNRDLMIFVTPTVLGRPAQATTDRTLTFTNEAHRDNIAPPLLFDAEARRE